LNYFDHDFGARSIYKVPPGSTTTRRDVRFAGKGLRASSRFAGTGLRASSFWNLVVLADKDSSCLQETVVWGEGGGLGERAVWHHSETNVTGRYVCMHAKAVVTT